MLKKLYNFFAGMYTLKAHGNTERFLNEARRYRLKLFELKKTEGVFVTFRIYKTDYKKLLSVAQYTHTSFEIIRNHGFLHSIRRFRQRIGIAAGILIFAVLFFLSTLFVWDVKIGGCQNTTTEEIAGILEKSGLTEGMYKKNLNVKKIENDFLTNNKKVSWVSINIIGTTAYVEIREKEEKPQFIDASEPCSVYASRDGVIASIEAYMGFPVLSEGDTVTAGDLVVSGDYTDKYGEKYLLHSYAKVMAYTTHSYDVTVPFEKEEHIRTGNIKNKYSIKLIRFNIPLYFSKKIRYNNYDVTTSEKMLRIGKSLALPVSVVKTTYTEVEKNAVKRSEEAALSLAKEKLYDLEYNLVGITVNDRKYEKTVNEDGVTLKVILDCYEDIGIKGKIKTEDD